MEKTESVIWAVDPNEEKLRPSQESLASMRQLLGGSLALVHPVYICDNEKLPLEAAQLKVQEFLKPLNLGHTLPVEVYRSSSHKRSEWAERIINLAHVQKAKLILLTSHGRSSVGAFFIGSFAREILQRSNIPVLVISPQKTSTEQSNQALFATDFSESSKKSFFSFLDLVQRSTSEVTLCHVVSDVVQASGMAHAYGAPVILPENFMKKQKTSAHEKMNTWLLEAREAYHDLQFKGEIIDAVTSTDGAIQELGLKQKISLIGVAAHTGPLEGLFFGSVTQSLVSSKKFNLWISGPNLGAPRFRD